jgi:tetratricopeptide (TPR) repeat protein
MAQVVFGSAEPIASANPKTEIPEATAAPETRPEPGPKVIVEPQSNLAGQRIGRYKLLQQIGEGGGGVVYMAEQEEPVRRRVALKIIKLGMDTKQVVARFEAERQALALMDHPNIAKVHDAAATQTGRPYFVMELVRGVKITDYCDQNNLPTAKRLDLFIQVCKAVQHAHQKGIIHRDIKPSNILVTLHDGVPVPKVIDFGIAKATTGQPLTDKTLFTAFEQFIGTPAYMSPEQAEMSGLDIDTRSDIYSLGVLLYELLTSKVPFEAKELAVAGLDEMRRIIREKDPIRPSTKLSSLDAAEQTTVAKRRQAEPPRLIHQIRGDLDWIVMKCLEKDRTRRYETANGLAQDLERHLKHEPVTACPPSAMYQFQKLVHRHKVFVAAAGAVATALVLGLVGSTWQAFRATRAEREQSRLRQESESQRKLAQTQAARSDEVARFLKKILASVGPSVAQGRDTKLLAAVLDEAALSVGRDLTNQPEVELEIRVTLAETYEWLGLNDKAEKMATEAVALGRRLNRESLPLASALHILGWVQWRLDNAQLAEISFREALTIRTNLLGTENAAVAYSLDRIAYVLASEGKFAEAEESARAAVALRRKFPVGDDPVFDGSVGTLASVLWQAGRSHDAEPYGRESLEVCRKVLGNKNHLTSFALNKLALILESQGEFPEAEELIRECLAIQRKVLDPNHPELSLTVAILGRILAKRGSLTQAELFYREEISNSPASMMPSLLSQLAGLQARKERWKEAAEQMAQALDLEKGNPEPYFTLAALLVAAGDLEGYRKLCGEIQSRFRETKEPFDTGRMAKVCLILPDSGADLAIVRRWADVPLTPETAPSAAPWMALNRSIAAYRQGQFGAAIESAHKALSQTGWSDDRRYAESYALMAMAHFGLNRVEDARKALEIGKDIERTRLPPVGSTNFLEGSIEDLIIARTLMKEAETLIQGQSPNAEGTPAGMPK